ncbi:MAG: hypothetical protein Q9M36_01075, partial [Sulfurovum sp.]|nr:hypothetical protein [Sulfurovum sp.]
AIFDTNSNGIHDAGDTITYSFLVENTGNVDLTGIFITDARIGITNLGVADLIVGASDTVTAEYNLTLSDINDGNVTNSALVIATPPSGNDVNDTSDDNSSSEDNATISFIIEAPSIALIKTGVAPNDILVGETMIYTFLVTNMGNVTLNNINIDDTRIGVVDLLVPNLAVGESTTVTAEYNLTLSDILDRNISNQAVVTGTSPQGTDVNDTSDDNLTLKMILR